MFGNRWSGRLLLSDLPARAGLPGGLMAVAMLAMLLVGCGSSGGNGNGFTPFVEKYIAPGSTVTLDYDDLGPGGIRQLAARSYGIEYSFEDWEESQLASDPRIRGYRQTNFTFEVDEDGQRIITMETAQRRMVVREEDEHHFIRDWGPEEGHCGVVGGPQPGDAFGAMLSTYHDYVHFGAWVYAVPEDPPEEVYVGLFRLGLMTHPDNTPETGEATYSSAGRMAMYGQGNHTDHGVYDLMADSLNIEVDFATGDLSGTIGGVIAAEQGLGLIEAAIEGEDPVWESFNDIFLEGSIVEDTAAFEGDVSAGEPGDSRFSFSEGADDGRFGGEFYGPEAEELGGMWRLGAPDNVVMGVFGGTQDPQP